MSQATEFGFSVDQVYCIDNEGKTALFHKFSNIVMHPWRDDTCIILRGNDAFLETREKPRFSKAYWAYVDNHESSFEFTEDIEGQILERLKSMDNLEFLPMNYHMPDEDAVNLIKHYCELRKNKGVNPTGNLLMHLSWYEKPFRSDGSEYIGNPEKYWRDI